MERFNPSDSSRDVLIVFLCYIFINNLILSIYTHIHIGDTYGNFCQERLEIYRIPPPGMLTKMFFDFFLMKNWAKRFWEKWRKSRHRFQSAKICRLFLPIIRYPVNFELSPGGYRTWLTYTTQFCLFSATLSTAVPELDGKMGIISRICVK